jgi:hypothetical protein
MWQWLKRKLEVYTCIHSFSEYAVSENGNAKLITYACSKCKHKFTWVTIDRSKPIKTIQNKTVKDLP